MKLFVLAAFAFLAVSAKPLENSVIDWSKVVPVQETEGLWDGRKIKPQFNEVHSGRIVGGIVVYPHTHPYQVALLTQIGTSTSLCGGTRISSGTVMTAAHCLPDNALRTLLIFGAHSYQTDEPSQIHRTVFSTQYRVHVNYDPNNFNNDIALILITPAVPTSNFIQNIALAPANSNSFAGAAGVVIGWGRTTDSSLDTSPVLRAVTTTVITNDACDDAFLGIVASQICILTTGGRGSCKGDSGGPLTTLVGGKVTQIGVVSFGAGTCEGGYPVVFTRVSSFRAWIAANWIA